MKNAKLTEFKPNLFAQRNKTNQKGFTLIESVISLMVTLLIFVSVLAIYGQIRNKYQNYKYQFDVINKLNIQRENIQILLKNSSFNRVKNNEEEIIGLGNREEFRFISETFELSLCSSGLVYEVIILKFLLKDDKKMLVCYVEHQNNEAVKYDIYNPLIIINDLEDGYFSFSLDGVNWYDEWPNSEIYDILNYKEDPIITENINKSFEEVIQEAANAKFIASPFVKLNLRVKKMPIEIAWVMSLNKNEIQTIKYDSLLYENDDIFLDGKDRDDLLIP